MDATVRELRSEFGINIAEAAAGLAQRAQSKKVPEFEVYTIATHTALMFAAGMAYRHVSRADFLKSCALVYDGVKEAAAHTSTERRN